MGILTRVTKNLYRRKNRTIMIIITLTFALTLLIVLPPSINERVTRTQAAIDTFVGWNELVAADVTLSTTEIQCEYGTNFKELIGVGGYVSYKLMNQSLYHSIASIPDVNTVIPTLNDLSTENRSYAINGVSLSGSTYLKATTILPSNITMGRNLQVGDNGVIVVDEIVAKNFTWGQYNSREEEMEAFYAKDYLVHVGDSFEISGHKFTVVGIECYSFTKGSHGVTMSLEDAWVVTGKSGFASHYVIFVDTVDSVGPVVTRIQNLDSKLLISAGYLQLNTVSEVLSQLDDLTNNAQSVLYSIQGIGTAEIAFIVIVIIVVMLFMMLYSVRERTKEIGALKAMGASNSTILGQFVLEGMLLCLISVVIALFIGVFVMPPVTNVLLPTPVTNYPYLSWYPNGTKYISTDGYMNDVVTPASVTFELVLFAVGIALLLGVLGSLYPALKAARTKPAEAMRYE
jgi:putative ABC transport system permease protein